MTYTVHIIEIEKGAAVKFPFELKNQFRRAFRSAKWNAREKQWEVGQRSFKRLQGWIDEVNASGIVEQIETRDQTEMTEQELRGLRTDLNEIKKNIEAASNSISTLADIKIEIEETKVALATKRDELEVIKEKREELAKQVESERVDVHAIVSNVVDIDEIEEARGEMRKHMRIAKAWASAKYEEAEVRLRDMRDRLEDAGIECEAIETALRANKNRPDRDYDDLFGPLDFKVA